MSHNYHLYGLTLQSPLRLPCPVVQSSVQPDVVLKAASSTSFEYARARLTPAQRESHWFAHVRLAGGATYIRWQDLFEFLVSPDGREITYHRERRAAADSFAVYLLGQVLSFSLLARGVEALHGTVSVVDGTAVAFVGDCGEGKSTLAAAMLARHFPVLTDDLVVLDEREKDWMAHPGVPRIKLFPSVARQLLGSVPHGVTMNTGTSKLVLPLGGAQAQGHPVPLRAVYVLSRPQDSRRREQPVRIEPLSGTHAFLEIVRAAFNLLVHERDRLANQFSFASRLIDRVPIRRLIYPRSMSLLPSVCDAVVSDVARG